ncbi:MAG: membrane protein insertion efficiency factor YidD [Dehalococcoidia bacterium]|nr:membrane protein insertion efficiency factor YidD [Dehalococcoidia bacterium]
MMARVLIGFVRAYQRTFGAVMPPVCRYAPSCSAYSVEALGSGTGSQGSWLTVRRLVRVQSWGGQG